MADSVAGSAVAGSAVAGSHAGILPADVTQEEAVSGAVGEAISRLGQLDIVVNNADGSDFMASFLDMRLAGWHKIMRLNLDSAVYVCHGAACTC